jgi:hypothetical protein
MKGRLLPSENLQFDAGASRRLPTVTFSVENDKVFMTGKFIIGGKHLYGITLAAACRVWEYRPWTQGRSSNLRIFGREMRIGGPAAIGKLASCSRNILPRSGSNRAASLPRTRPSAPVLIDTDHREVTGFERKSPDPSTGSPC